jgi:predicted O-methyltransferase YrrM
MFSCKRQGLDQAILLVTIFALGVMLGSLLPRLRLVGSKPQILSPSGSKLTTDFRHAVAGLSYGVSIPEKVIDVEIFVNEELTTDTDHLCQRTQYVKGPMQDDELLLMFALVRVIRPRTILEFGFHMGASANNWLKSSRDPRLKLFSWDISSTSEAVAKKMSQTDPRLTFIKKPQEEFDSRILRGRNVDIVLLDAGHTLKSQVSLWTLLQPVLSANSFVVIHDTGRKKFDLETARAVQKSMKTKVLQVPIYTQSSCKKWNKLLNTPNRCSCRCAFTADQLGYCCTRTTKEEERAFVKYIYETFPEWRPIYLHSFRFWRHGLTILQQRKLGLPTENMTEHLNIY